MSAKAVIENIFKYVKSSAKKYEHLYILFGWYALITYPAYFFVWYFYYPRHLDQSIYRIIAALFGIGLILINYWPARLKKYIPFYWYLSIIYCVPFFFTYFLLLNQKSTAWLLNSVTAIFLMIVLTDWIPMLVISFVGIATGTAYYILTNSEAYFSNNLFIIFLTCLPIIVAAIILLKKDTNIQEEKLLKERLLKEKESALKAAEITKREAAEKTAKHMQTLAATIAHELRTPLGAIDNMATCLELLTDELEDGELKQNFIDAYELILGETAKTNGFITIILESLTELKNKSFTKNSIKHCVMEAVDRFPYEYDEKKIVHMDKVEDFDFMGDREIFIHVLFNLIKNALYFIQAAEKGQITIWTECGDDFNCLHFKDTGMGMPPNKADKIFDKFYTDTGVGTGIGLYFCKNAMNIMGGDIVCNSEEGKFAHFILSFPKIN